MSPTRALVLVLPALVGFAAIASAQPPALAPEADQPYLWRVVVQARPPHPEVAALRDQPHPVFTPDFRDRLRRDLHDALQAGLGPLGTVDVVDLAAVPRSQWEPLWTQFDDAGFPALDTPRELTAVKTHFLRLDYRDGVYSLETRQHDGFTGLASPVVRRAQVRDPEMVSRAAGLLLDQDFGPVGTIELLDGKKDEVRVRFRGGRVASLDRFVAIDDVFAVASVFRTTRAAAEPVRSATGKVIAPTPGTEPKPALQPARREFTYLRVKDTPRDGVCTCTVLTRLKAPFAGERGVIGYRCLRLTTTSAPVSVRLVRSDGKPHQAASPFRVYATTTRFTTDPKPEDFLDSAEGVFRTARPLKGLACVVVGGQARAEFFPIPVVSSDPVTLKFELDEGAEDKAAYTRSVVALAVRASDARSAQAGCFEATAKLIEARKNPDALARATAGFRATDASVAALADDLSRLRDDLHKAPEAAELLTGIERQIQDLREGNSTLAARIKDLEAVVKKETGPAADAVAVQADAANVQIGILVSRGDIDEALVAYDRLVTLLPDNPEIKARREKLRAEWQPRSPEHAKARDYLFKAWPGLNTLAEFRAELGNFRAAVEVCKASGDRHGLRKVLTSLPAFAGKLEEQIKALDPATEAGTKGLDDAKAVRDEMVKLEQEIQDALRQQGK
jgi:tetratricopeptide (TPR) repeat protein